MNDWNENSELLLERKWLHNASCMALSRHHTEVNSLQFEAAVLIAVKRAAARSGQRPFARVAFRSVDRYEDVGVCAASKLVAGLHHDAVLYAAESCAFHAVTHPFVITIISGRAVIA